MTDALQLLIRSPFFEPIPDRHLTALAEMAVAESYEADDSIVTQHEPAEACHVLIDGEVELSDFQGRSIRLGATEQGIIDPGGPPRSSDDPAYGGRASAESQRTSANGARMLRDLGDVVKRLRGKLDYTPIGFAFLPPRFTLREAQEVHEAIRKHSRAAADHIKSGGGDNDLLDRLRGEPLLKGVDLDGVLDPAAYVGRAPEQVDRFLREVVEPVRKRYATP